MNRLRDRIIASILNHPKGYLFASFLSLLILIPGLGMIGQDYTYRAWYSPKDPLLVRYDKFERRFGNDDSAIFILYSEEGLYHPEAIQLIYTLTEKLWLAPYVARVDSLTNYDYIEIRGEDEIDIAPMLSEDELANLDQATVDKIRSRVQGDDLIEDVVISADGKLAIIKGQLHPSFDVTPDNQVIVDYLRTVAKEYQSEKYTIHVAGTAILTNYYKEIANSDTAILLPLLYLIFTFILIYLFRTKTGVLLPYLIISVSIAMMMGTAGYLGEKLNSLSSAAPNILMTVAIADAIHLLTVFYLSLRSGMSRLDSLRYSMEKNFYPTLLTSLTTSVGFLSFAQAKITAVAMMGLEVAIGVMYAWFLTYFMIAPIMRLIPDKTQVIAEEEIEEEVEQTQILDPKFQRRVGLLDKYKYAIVGITLLITGFGVYYFQFLEVNMDPYGQFKEHHELNIINRLVNKHLGPMSAVEIMIDSGEENGAKDPAFLKKVEGFQNWLIKQDYIHKANSIVDIVKELNQKLNANNKEYYRIPDTSDEVGQELFFYTLGLPPGRELNNRISLNNQYIRVSATWRITRSTEANEKIEMINSKIKEFGLDGVITGKMPLFHDLTPYIVSTFLKSFLIALVSIVLIMVLVLQSIKLGLLALLPNLFPLIVGSALYSLLHIEVDIASVLIASVTFGIAVDDSIHFLFEYKKFKAKGMDIMTNLATIMKTTYPSLFNTTLLIAIGFGSFAIAEYIPNAKFGISVAFILSVALVADFFVLPAILLITEKRK